MHTLIFAFKYQYVMILTTQAREKKNNKKKR